MIILVCVLIGLSLGLLFPYHIPSDVTQYIAIIILALLDSVFGAMTAHTQKNFALNTFITGIISNALLAILLTYIGNKLNVDLYLVTLLVFGTRMFTNLSAIRRFYLPKITEKFKKKSKK